MVENEFEVTYKRIFDSVDEYEDIDSDIEQYLNLVSEKDLFDITSVLSFTFSMLSLVIYLTLFTEYVFLGLMTAIFLVFTPAIPHISRSFISLFTNKLNIIPKINQLEKNIKNSNEQIAIDANNTYLKVKELLLPFKKTLYFSKTKQLTKDMKNILSNLPKKYKKWNTEQLINVYQHTKQLKLMIPDIENSNHLLIDKIQND